MKTIEAFAFSDCSNLSFITLSQGLSTIGDNAFSNCSSLWNIFIPDSVEIIGKDIFSNCPSLKHIYVISGSYSENFFANNSKLVIIASASSTEPVSMPSLAEDPNIPHLFITDETYPENTKRGSVVVLDGVVYTDKGVITMVWGRILDSDGNIVQECTFYPYSNSFDFHSTINTNLIFGSLDFGVYTYVVSAIAENNSFTNGEEILIEQSFKIT